MIRVTSVVFCAVPFASSIRIPNKDYRLIVQPFAVGKPASVRLLPRKLSFTISSAVKSIQKPAMGPAGFHFEVFGKVQGVFFRACTAEEANNLGIVGWVRNTASGSVEGEAQGPEDKLASFKDFLQHKGSPGSRIDRCEITDEVQDLPQLAFTEFSVKR